jgi:hypothetical protein
MLALKHKTTRRVLQCVGVGLGACLIVLLVIPLLGPGWHLLHGDFISYGGWRIPVPKGFYVRKFEVGPTMWKTSLGIPLFNVPYGHISLFSRPAQQPFAYDRDYSRFETGIIQEAGQSGYQLESKRTISVGKNPGYCLEFTRSSGEPRSLVRCVIENSVVVLFYEGDPRYISDVFAVLQGMSLERTKSESLHLHDGEYGLTCDLAVFFFLVPTFPSTGRT